MSSSMSRVAPLLETLRIDCSDLNDGLSVENGIDMFSGGTDRLRDVDLYHVPIPWSSRPLSGLEKIRITGINMSPGPSSSEITDVLRRCPKLRDFELAYHIEEVPALVATPSEGELAHLPFLTSFKLDLDNAKTFNGIILSVRIPTCAEFELMCLQPISNIFSNETSHLTTVLVSAIQHVSQMSLRLSSSSLWLRGWHKLTNEDININLDHHSPWEGLARLMNAPAQQ
ncbi:hypothetical protein FRB95_001473 [Tulasnella sp. JGI-2019a]|nr:hypothetical protein FRB93_006238 [Tulasnella sp. JGI-2019a]KAG9032420.1 hypothetical protein FRB95_001473 [Tulasnella sp. JGI-2019a]